MSPFWSYQKFNRRVFISLVATLLLANKRSALSQTNTIKCNWCWVGAVTDRSITIKAKHSNKISPKNYIQIFYDRSSDLSFSNREINKVEATSFLDKIATFELTDLAADTIYHYIIIANGRRYPTEGTLQFKTVKIARPYNFAIACSSCAGGTIGQYTSSGVSNSKVFDLIRQYKYKTQSGRDSQLDMFIHMGDLHYRNDFPWLGLKEDYLDDYRENYDLVMNQSNQRNLYQNIPLAYIWDDHDYGTNDSDGNYALKYTASQAYREQVPSYPLVETLNKTQGKGAIYQSFAIGRVRFIMTDSRFYQDDINPTEPNKTILGNEQKAWLYEQLLLGKKQQINQQEALTIWINSIPWIGDKDDPETKSWNKFSRERTEIANFIKNNNIDNLMMISGDAHMLAIDDGTLETANSYATGGGGSFPVIQVAALDSRGSYKGGPYNGEQYIVDSDVKSKNGAIKGKGQWGVFNFIDYGNKIAVEVELKRGNKTLIQHSFIFD
jgi:phosphodiesterase/alkaline phosphatase D-like protein